MVRGSWSEVFGPPLITEKPVGRDFGAWKGRMPEVLVEDSADPVAEADRELHGIESAC
jgi:hypothetical protein